MWSLLVTWFGLKHPFKVDFLNSSTCFSFRLYSSCYCPLNFLQLNSNLLCRWHHKKNCGNSWRSKQCQENANHPAFLLFTKSASPLGPGILKQRMFIFSYLFCFLIKIVNVHVLQANLAEYISTSTDFTIHINVLFKDTLESLMLLVLYSAKCRFQTKWY